MWMLPMGKRNFITMWMWMLPTCRKKNYLYVNVNNGQEKCYYYVNV
jgi:hypothetical protein